MNRRITRFAISLSLAAFATVPFAAADDRVWTDITGMFRVTAEFVAVENNEVVLRRAGGETVRVPIKQLSEEDQEIALRAQLDRRSKARTSTTERGNRNGDMNAARVTLPEDQSFSTTAPGSQTAASVKSAANEFFAGLRGPERVEARELLTSQAQQLSGDPDAPLAKLPAPDPGRRAIVTGRPTLSESTAEIPVTVKAGRSRHQTTLHMRLEDDQWKVFAISAVYPDGERSIDFEAEPMPPGAANSLESLLGKPMPLAGFTLPGPPLNLSRFNGNVVLVDFWATWCGPCRAEMPNIMQNWQKYHDDGFEVIAISLDKDLDSLRKYVVENRLPWTVVADKDPRNQLQMATHYGVRAIPTMVLIGRDGKVASINPRGPRLEKELKKLLADGSQDPARNDGESGRREATD